MGSYRMEDLSGDSKNELEAIAVVGMSIGFPGDITSPGAFWNLLMKKEDTASRFPESRMNIDAIYHPDSSRRGQIPVANGHFLQQNLECFDASFFSTSSTDAATMDPQQRLLLEYTYKALENAGMSLDAVSGSKTSVFTGSFATDWQHIAYKDGEQCETTAALGNQACFNANRISWFFDFTGNSANIDTACSSSLVALHLGCQGLRSGDENMSIVAGSNLILSPDNMHSLTNLNMLSPDGKCYSFDHRANGYSRGEGFGVLVLKRISDAIRDQNTIRGIIRNTGCNQDGHTPSITVPSSILQEKLIRETYMKAGLSMKPTRFFEAHGTGTPVGDPNECKALGCAFRQMRTVQDPLWVGAVKSNIGHLEGASGIAGVIKAILILEKGIIPPNTNFEKPNPKIDMDFLRIQFPLEPIPWPVKGLRRASVNSFGNAGTNAHVVLDDVLHFLEERSFHGHHITVRDPPSPKSLSPSAKSLIVCPSLLRRSSLCVTKDAQVLISKLLIFSAFDAAGVKRQVQAFGKYFTNLEIPSAHWRTYLEDLSFTLSLRRYSLPWKVFAVVRTPEDLQHLEKSISTVTKSVPDLRLGYIFTGQGAQWAGMARELLVYQLFRRSLEQSEQILLDLGAPWYLCEELLKEDQSSINRPQFSQSICTAVQIALMDLLRSFDIHPTTVVGHSSGEIAAAYGSGAISARSAMKLSYYRGVLASSLTTSQSVKGGMMSVALSDSEVLSYIDRVSEQFDKCGLAIACINSPRNVTISGDQDQIEALEKILSTENVLCRQLVVDVAYHSPHMQAISEAYGSMIRSIEPGDASFGTTIMISTVSGHVVNKTELLAPEYWVSNMVSPVRFDEAIRNLLSRSGQRIRRKLDRSHRKFFQVGMLVEVGPHSALQRPIKEISADLPGMPKISYTSVLTRKTSALDSMHSAVGQMLCLGYNVNLSKVNIPNTMHASGYMPRPMVLPDFPGYVFDHSKQYWSESRLSARYRLHNQGKLDLLGKPVIDWNPMEPRWRNILRISEMPWMEDHVINGSTIYPGAGMIVMAIEAANQLSRANDNVFGFEIKDVVFAKPLNIPQDTAGIETQLSLRIVQESTKQLATWTEFRLFAYEQNTWRECCHGHIRIMYKLDINEVSPADDLQKLKEYHRKAGIISQSCNRSFVPTNFYGMLEKIGLALGPSFQSVIEGVYGSEKQAQGSIKLYQWPEKEYPQSHVIHPISLDAVFHFAIAGYFGGGTKAVSTMVPTFLRHLSIRKDGLQFSKTDNVLQVEECAWTTKEDNLGVEFCGFALNATREKCLVDFTDLKVTKIGEYLEHTDVTSGSNIQKAHHIRYQPDPDLLTHAEILVFCQPSPESKGSPFQCYINMLAHKISDLKILEIYDGSQEICAPEIIKTLSISDAKGEIVAAVYDSYCLAAVHTDMSDYYYEELKSYPRMSFSSFDVNEDMISQGFKAEFYDVVVVPSNLCEDGLSLQELRKTLKLNGKLVFTNLGDSVINNGNHSLTRNKDLFLSSKSELIGPGFDICTSNGTGSPTVACVHVNTPNITPSSISKTVYIVLDPTSAPQVQSGKQLTSVLDLHSLVGAVTTISLADVATMESLPDDSIFVVLLEFDQPYLYSLSEADYHLLKSFLIHARSVVWVNAYGKPEYTLIQGLARVIRSEYNDHLLTVTSFERKDTSLSLWQLQSLVELLTRNHISDTSGSYARKDFEYIEIDGALNIPRITPDYHLSNELQLRESPQQSGVSQFENAPPLQMAIKSPGFLETIHFQEDAEISRPLADHEVEIRTCAIGMNPKDCSVALGQLQYAKMGQECAGIVVRAGADTSFSPGDHILLTPYEGFKTFARGPAYAAHIIPDDMSFAIAAAIPEDFGTSWGIIQDIARLQRNETILIHSAAQGMGQAAIQIAQLIGATIIATVSTKSEKQILIDEYFIPEEQIFYSQDTSFAEKTKLFTHGRGVNVVINSLSGEGLIASWECIAPYGRFVDISSRDIISNSNLPMALFQKNVTFTGFDRDLWNKQSCSLGSLIEMVAKNKLQVPRPFSVQDISEVQHVFQLAQEGHTAGKTVFEITQDSCVQTTLATHPSFQLDSNATYVIAGGFGGIGRATARWMASRNARNLILLSRYGPRIEAAHKLLEELRSQNVRVEAPACDISNITIMRKVFATLSLSMPPIKGCLQASIVAKDMLFKDMDYEDWKPAVECKSVGSWNLHLILPSGMNFFVLLASASGLAGLRGQANYNAGNTYEDALARYRVSQGEKAISLDLGALTEDGILAENMHLLDRVLGYGTLEPISRRKYFAMLDYYCNPSLALLSPADSQTIIGIGAGGGSGLETFDFTNQPMLYPLVVASSHDQSPTVTASQVEHRKLFAASISLDEGVKIIEQGIVSKLAKSLSVFQGTEEVDLHKPLQAYGVDSLLAIELRNWLVKEFVADVAVFETQGASTLETLSRAVAAKSRVRHEGWTIGCEKEDGDRV